MDTVQCDMCKWHKNLCFKHECTLCKESVEVCIELKDTQYPSFAIDSVEISCIFRDGVYKLNFVGVDASYTFKTMKFCSTDCADGVLQNMEAYSKRVNLVNLLRVEGEIMSYVRGKHALEGFEEYINWQMTSVLDMIANDLDGADGCKKCNQLYHQQKRYNTMFGNFIMGFGNFYQKVFLAK